MVLGVLRRSPALGNIKMNVDASTIIDSFVGFDVISHDSRGNVMTYAAKRERG